MAQTFVFANNVNTTLADAATSTQTTLTLSSSANFPTIPTGAYWPLTLNDRATEEVYEIVYVSSYSGAVVTCLRGQEGTSANSWLVGDYIYSDNTALTTAPAQGNPATPFQTDALTASGLITANGGITVPSGQEITAPTIAGNPSFSGGLIVPSGEVATIDGTITILNATASNNPVALGQFVQSLSSNGYQMLPSGLIIQWGSLNVGSNSSATFTFPIAFPHAMFQLVLTQIETVPTTGSWGWGNNTSTQVGIYNGNSGSASVSIICIGY